MQNIEALAIKPTVQNYHWGKKGKDSLVARLFGQINPDLTYAELWFGSHPKSPSKALVASGPEPLDTLIQNKPIEILGAKTNSAFGATLPFLAKVLSIDQALSIQSHPSIENAKILHQKDPTNYPDSNHKPEIALALTEVEMLHGWIDQEELEDLKIEFPILFEFLSSQKIEAWTTEDRKKLVSFLFALNADVVEKLNLKIFTQLRSLQNLSRKQKLFLDLSPHVEAKDVGLIVAMFLRVLKLKAGDSIFTDAGEIHAYLSGDLFECMANSDNVIRAGLTPKFQDVEALLSYANFEIGSYASCAPVSEGSEFLKHPSNAAEFQVYSIPKSTQKVSYNKSPDSPELLVILEGRVKVGDIGLEQGMAALIPANQIQVDLVLNNAYLVRVTVP